MTMKSGDTIRYCKVEGCKGIIVEGIEGPVCSECGSQPDKDKKVVWSKQDNPLPGKVTTASQTTTPVKTEPKEKPVASASEILPKKNKRGGAFKPKHLYLEAHKAEIIKDYQSLQWNEVIKNWDVSDTGLRTILIRWGAYKPGQRGGNRIPKKDSVSPSGKPSEIIPPEPSKQTKPIPQPDRIALLEARIKRLEDYIVLTQKLLIMEWTNPYK